MLNPAQAQVTLGQGQPSSHIRPTQAARCVARRSSVYGHATACNGSRSGSAADHAAGGRRQCAAPISRAVLAFRQRRKRRGLSADAFRQPLTSPTGQGIAAAALTGLEYGGPSLQPTSLGQGIARMGAAAGKAYTDAKRRRRLKTWRRSVDLDRQRLATERLRAEGLCKQSPKSPPRWRTQRLWVSCAELSVQ